MPEIVTDSVDAYIFRRAGQRVQYLLLQRDAVRTFGSTWQSMHSRIQGKETTLAAARRSVRESIGVDPLMAYSIDYISQIFDHERDVIVFAPAIAFALAPGGDYTLGDGFKAMAWFDAEDAASRLLWAGQREAIRIFSKLVRDGGDDLDLYRIG
ncbi:MAG: NUDIX domain-containing protein [Thermomicrobiales bacterium]